MNVNLVSLYMFGSGSHTAILKTHVDMYAWLITLDELQGCEWIVKDVDPYTQFKWMLSRKGLTVCASAGIDPFRSPKWRFCALHEDRLAGHIPLAT